MPNTQKLLILLFTIILGLGIQGCSSPGLDGGSDRQGADGSGTGGADDIDSDGQVDGVSTISVTVDASLVMLTDESTGSFRGVGANSINIRELNYDEAGRFSFSSDPSGITVDVEKDDSATDSNTFTLEFRNAVATSEQLNLAIEVTLANNDRLYALLFETGGTNISTNQSIRVSTRTTYLYKLLFESLANQQQLEDLLPCTNINNCDNQYYAKYAVFRSLFAAIDSIDLGGEIVEQALSYDDAIALLTENASLNQSLRPQIQSLLTEGEAGTNTQFAPFAYGTRRESIPLDGSLRTRLGDIDSYNSSYFSIGLDRNSSEISLSHSRQLNQSPRVVPRIEIFNTYFREQASIISRSEIPYSMEFLELDSNGSADTEDNLFLGSIPSLVTSIPTECKDSARITNDTRQTRKGELVASRAIPQQIPRCINGLPGEAVTVTGWTHDPVFSLLYKSNEYIPDTSITNLDSSEIPEYGDSPTWLTSAYMSGTQSFNITRNSNDFDRGAQTRDIDMFAWEIHGLAPAANPSTNTISGRNYGAVSFIVDLDEDEDSISVSTDVLTWTTNTQEIDETPISSRRLSRSFGNSPNLNQDLRAGRGFDYDAFDSTSYPGAYSFNNSFEALGHISETGGQIAITDANALRINGTDTVPGIGLTFGTELRSTGVVFQDTEIFTLQGNIIELDQDFTRLYNITGSQLSLQSVSDQCSAELQITYTSSQRALPNEESLPQQNVSASGFSTTNIPTPIDTTPLFVSSTSCSVSSSGEITINFTEALTETSALTLRGYISRAFEANSTSSGNLISLIWDQSQAQGLVFAQKDQQIQVQFEN